MSAEKIGDIKEQLKSITDSQLTQFIEAYGSDERGGVIKLVDSAKKRLDKYEKELIRTEGLKKYEREYASYAHICGIDDRFGRKKGHIVERGALLPVAIKAARRLSLLQMRLKAAQRIRLRGKRLISALGGLERTVDLAVDNIDIGENKFKPDRFDIAARADLSVDMDDFAVLKAAHDVDDRIDLADV